MLTQLKATIQDLPLSKNILLMFLVASIACVFTAIISEQYVLAAIPAVFLVVYVAIVDFSYLYWLLIASIPFSTEVYLPNGIGTDLPTEPLTVGLMLLFGIFVLSNLRSLSFNTLKHPLTLFLLLHIGWIAISTLVSDHFIISLKFLLAKIWYVTTFFFLSIYLIRDQADFKKLFWVFFWPFLIVALIIFTRHALGGFTFLETHAIMHPFHRNHVSYAAILTLFFPFLVMMRNWYPKGDWRRTLLLGSSIFIFIAIYFTYTRAAYVALIIALGAYFVIQWRLVKAVLVLATIVVSYGVYNLVQHNNYLEYAPNFETTISHEQFDNLLEATYKMEDISTMERVYRWVAAGHMAPERPFFGWGPGNFYTFYKSFTVTSFRTYVSDNPEQSGIHNYFFMTLVEQGIIGLIIFVILLYYFLIRGEKLYHRLKAYPMRQQMIMMCMLSVIIISAFLLINDLIETDKVGSFFFICYAILIRQDLFLLEQAQDKRLEKKTIIQIIDNQ